MQKWQLILFTIKLWDISFQISVIWAMVSSCKNCHHQLWKIYKYSSHCVLFTSHILRFCLYETSHTIYIPPYLHNAMFTCLQWQLQCTQRRSRVSCMEPAEEVGHGWTLLIKMSEVTLIDVGYCKIESFLAFSMTGPSLESWFENWGPTSVKVEIRKIN